MSGEQKNTFPKGSTMNKRMKNSIAMGMAMLGSLTINAQLMVQEGESAQQMAETITGRNVEILNPVITCSDGAWGTFQADDDSLQLDEGILLTTGRIINALGPNDTESKSTVNVGVNGDPKLDIIAGYATRDACKLEFDIIPSGDTLTFNFSMASEEYNEYVCNVYNDVFGFFISGPGIVGDPALSGAMNIAVIPGTNTPITINNVNQGNPNQGAACVPVNPQYHVQNPLSPIATIQYDGWTKGLVAIAGGLIPCETYHLELIVADATDRLWDTGVFIEEIQSNSVILDVVTQGGNPIMYEECNNGTLSFCLEEPINEDTEVFYLLQGSAINGVDYELIDDPDPEFQHPVIIPAGESCASVSINTIADGEGEGIEFIDVILKNPFCDEIILDSIRTFIYDSLEVFINGDDLLCLDESTTLSLDSGGTSFIWSSAPAVTFNPDNTSTEVTITPTQSTNVFITTTIANCSANDELLVQVSDMSLGFDVSGISCEDVCNGAIDMTISNGIEPFLISWDGVVSTEDQSDLCAGDYTVRVLDAAGCEISEIVTVGLAPPIEVVISPITYVGGDNVSCNGAVDGAVDVVIIGGTAPYDTTYSAGPDGLGIGPITVDVIDDNGCTATSTVVLTEPDVLSGIITDLQQVDCFGEETGSATVACVGGSGNCASIIWMDGTTTVNSGATYSDAPAGTYTVMLQDENNCTGQIEVTIPGPASAVDGEVVSQVDVACFGENTGSVEVAGSGGSISVGSDYNYLWQDDLSASPIRTGLLAGSYTVVISDDNGCTNLLTIVIDEPTQLDVTIAIENDIQCEGQSCGNALAVGSGGTPGSPSYTYEWETVPAGISPDFPQFSPAASFCDAGQYSITVTDANNCKVDTIIDITIISPIIEATFDITDVPCAGDSTGAIDATVTGGLGPLTYEWVGGNCNQGPFFTEDIMNVCAGIWSVTITDSVGCAFDTTLVIIEPPSLNYFFEMTPTLCADNCSGSIDFTPAGGTPPYSYAWFGPVFPGSGDLFDLNDTISTGEDLTSLCKGLYLISLSDSLGCNFERTITVTAPEDLVILTDSISDYNGFEVSCPDACDGYIYITAQGGTVAPADDYQYLWLEQALFGAGTPFQEGDGPGFDDVTGLCASEDTVGYEVILVDDNQCIQNDFFIMEEPDELSFEFDVTDVTCSGFTDGAVTVTVTGGVPDYSYTWTDSTGTVISMTDSITMIGEGWYYISVMDMNGCMGDDSVLVATPNPLVVPLDFIPFNGFGVACVNDCNGTVFAPVTGGTFPYSYEWSDADCAGPYISTEPVVLGGLCAGTYYLNVSDSLGCMTCESLTLIEPDSILADNAVVIDISCEGETDGSINLMLTGGVPLPNYDVEWVPPLGIGQVANNLGEGEYTAIVTDANDCSAQFEFEIEEPEELIAVATSPLVNGGFNITCNGACDASLSLEISGGVGDYAVSWQGPAPVGGSSDSEFINVVCEGTYIYTVTDDNNCSVTDTIDITEPDAILFAFTVEEFISCNGECDGQLRVQASGGVPAYDYVWNDPDMTNGPLSSDNLCAQVYTVTVTDANDCEETGFFNLEEPDVLEISCTTSDITCTDADNGAIDCLLAGGTGPYTCVWTGPDGFTSFDEDLTNLAPGEYCVECEDARGCMVDTCYVIGEPMPLVLVPIISDYNGFGVTCLGDCNGSITLSATGGTGDLVFSPAEFQGDLCAGFYTVSVTDDLGCEMEMEVEITEPDEITIDLSSPLYACGTNINCFGFSTGSIISDVTGGVNSSYTYSWINVAEADTFNVGDDFEIDQIGAGDYTLFVEDGNGCSASADINLTEPSDQFTVDVMPTVTPGGSNISCEGACDASISVVDINACGAVEYSWTFNGDPISSDALVDLCPGQYTMVAIDEAECPWTESLTITEPESLNVVDSVTISLCAGDDNGAVFLTVNGGSPDYSFDWNDPTLNSVEDQTNLVPGDYSVLVSDFNGCEEELFFTITEPDSLDITLYTIVMLAPDFNISSYLGNDGVIDAEASGGTMPYTYLWSGDDGYTSDQEDLNGLTAQNYCVVVTDENGCTDGECIELTEPSDLELPNGMSPNGDGINDGLFIQGIEAFPNNTVKVFNRWGDVVFEQNGYSNSNLWKGESDSGGKVPDGTYFTILVVKDAGGDRELNAYLEIRR